MGLWSTDLHIIIVIAGGGSFPVAFLSWWLYVGQVSPPLGSETIVDIHIAEIVEAANC